MPNKLKMQKDRGELTETILGLTLRIIYLLTGGEYVIEKKTSGSKTSRSGNVEKTHHRRNHQEILELSNKIIELLTGEVPLRCQDVTVHFSMEEWEYLEGHKDLYQDVLTENLRLLTSPGHKGIEEISEEHVTPDSSPGSSPLRSTAPLTECNVGQNIALNNINEESMSCEENEDSSDDDFYKPTDLTQEYLPCNVNMVAVGCKDEDIIDVDIYIPIDHSMQSPSTSITEKLVSAEGQNQADIDVITIPDHSPTHSVSEESDWSDNEQSTYQDALIKPKNTINHLYHKSFHSFVQRPHNKDKKYNGALCESPFKKILDHMVEHTDYQSFICSECGKSLPSQSDLVIHQESHIKANKCSEVNRRKLYTRNPIPRPNFGGEEGFKCRICGLCFNNTIELVTHHQSHIKKPYPCSICGRGFYSRSGLVTHQKTHAYKRLYDCPTCGKTFISNAHLVLHQEVHGEAGDSSGTGADAGDSSGGGSNVTDYQHFGSQDKLFSCSICGECFYSSEQFLQHQKSHFKNDPLMCPECGKIFMRKSGLAKHKRVVHQGHIALSCAVCGKGFACRSELARHMTVHSGQKPYTCTECGKCFSFKSALVRHQRIHTGDRLQYCPDCGKGFSCNSELLRHQSVHQ